MLIVPLNLHFKVGGTGATNLCEVSKTPQEIWSSDYHSVMKEDGLDFISVLMLHGVSTRVFFYSVLGRIDSHSP